MRPAPGRGIFGTSIVPTVNGAVAKLIDAPLVGPLVRHNMVMISYVGRRSGKTITTPVGYRRQGDVITIGVQMPDAKTWWRNFLGDGSPMTLHLNGGDRTGRAVAERDSKGRVAVTVTLDPVTA